MIFNIQRYSTHDGPGIRTVIFLKGCSLSCVWCQNPESQSFKKEILFDSRLCIKKCDLCSKILPKSIKCLNNSVVIYRESLQNEDFNKLEESCPSLALSVCGKELSLQEVMEQVHKDKAFYQRSGGGVTLSGGEPFNQPDFTLSVLKESKNYGYHTAVETCLHTPWKYIEPTLPFIDLFLADLKHINNELFHQWTGGSIKRILSNLKKLSNSDKKMIIRVPVIQGFNADKHSLNSIIDFVSNELSCREIHFLPYHTLGMNKYHLLDRPYSAPLTSLNDSNLLEYAIHYAETKNLTAILKG